MCPTPRRWEDDARINSHKEILYFAGAFSYFQFAGFFLQRRDSQAPTWFPRNYHTLFLHAGTNWDRTSRQPQRQCRFALLPRAGWGRSFIHPILTSPSRVKYFDFSLRPTIDLQIKLL